MTDEIVTRLSSFFKVLGDETRVKILYTLSDGEKCVSDISENLGMSQSAVSHQLKQLKLEGQVKSRRDGKNIFYSLDDEHILTITDMALKHIKHKFR